MKERKAKKLIILYGIVTITTCNITWEVGTPGWRPQATLSAIIITDKFFTDIFIHDSWIISGYIWETSRSRTAHDRFSEHRRAVNRPLTYPDNALADHYLEFHDNLNPYIFFDILEINLYSTIKQKVTEAYYINLFKPNINNKEECDQLSLKGFLLQHIQRQI